MRIPRNEARRPTGPSRQVIVTEGQLKEPGAGFWGGAMNVLVTGGAGYIGSVVAAELLCDGHDVVVYDNLSRGHNAAVPRGAAFIQGNLFDGELLVRTLREHAVEAVMHFAALSLVGESVREPALYFRNNVAGTLHLLDAMRAAGVGRLIFSSTAAVYGQPEATPIAEDAALRPINPYGESKLMVETVLRRYDEAYGLRSVSLRYFNAAGAAGELGEEHHPETHLIPLVLAMALDLTRERSAVYNLGNGTGFSVRQVIEAARRVTGHPIPAEETARRAGDPAVLVASSARIQRDLGWHPQLPDIEQIIATAWDWHRAHPHGYAQ